MSEHQTPRIGRAARAPCCLPSTARLFVEMAVLFGLGTEPPEVRSTRNSEPKECGISGACHRRRRRRRRRFRFRRRHVSSLELCL